MGNNLIKTLVRKRTAIAKNIVEFELIPVEQNKLPKFTPGAHIDVVLGNDLIRQYSLHNSSREDHRYCIAVLLTDDSRGGSKAMHESIQEGDELQISAPRNNFHMSIDAPSSILFAGGIGITPLLCMSDKLASEGSDFQLHYCAKSKSHMAFRAFLLNCPFKNNVHVYYDDDEKSQQFNLRKALQNSESNSQIYLCGPSGFMDAIVAAATPNWLPDMIHREYFAAEFELHSHDEQAFVIRLVSTGDEYQIPPDKTIVEVLRENGIDVPVSCEQGICGTCLTDIVAGTPLHRDSFMTDEEHEENNSMTVCCSRSKDDLLVLDL